MKASFKNYCYFPFGNEKISNYFLSINILKNGAIEELYNGPGKYLVDNYILKHNLKHYKESYSTLSKGVILMEGDAEEILMPIMVKKVLGISLEELGISLINIRSTGFENVADIVLIEDIYE